MLKILLKRESMPKELLRLKEEFLDTVLKLGVRYEAVTITPTDMWFISKDVWFICRDF